jgi:glutaredoxin
MEEGFVVYSKNECRFCELSKQVLLDEGFPYQIVMCDNWLEQDREGFLKRMEEKIGKEYKTFPMVFYKERFVGGYKELLKKVEELSCFQ